MSETLWLAKLGARLHDPPEKALVLMRTAEGHEAGTSRTLRQQVAPDGFPADVDAAVHLADRWASAADRAAFPRRDGDGRYPAWQTVRFNEQPVLIHPLTGEALELRPLHDVTPGEAERLATEHLQSLVHEDDIRRTALAFWRFGPEVRDPAFRNLWKMLPADTRVPDHTIWDHLDLTAALATAFAADDGGPALMAVSLGPVQEVIASARSTSDLWAGSHLLSRIAWEAMRVVCEELGPEAVLFPRLRGVPQVDLWLAQSCGLKPELFNGLAWRERSTDANPLFAAALPNRFTALVPAGRARALGERITETVREWVRNKANEAFAMLLEAAGEADDPGLPGYAQIAEQLEGFPEVHWAAVPWSLVGALGEDEKGCDETRLAQAMQPFFDDTPPGYLSSESWKLMSRAIELESGHFWRPNPGALYPALHELTERMLSAVKSARPFAQTLQQGWRCALSGEGEWLTTDRRQLETYYGARSDTLWAKVAREKPSWVKRGEHLGALATLKRLWPSLFSRELSGVLGGDVGRYVVSTHTMALAGSLSGWLQRGEQRVPEALASRLAESRLRRVALPRRLHRAVQSHPECASLERLPGWLEEQLELAGEESGAGMTARRLVKDFLGVEPEAYYGLLMLDGDRMGAWLSAEREMTLAYQDSFHPQLRAGLRRFEGDPAFERLAASSRGATPSRHMAISDALSQFSLNCVPDIVENRHHGKLIYAGGDDVLAMLPVGELLPAMVCLRAAYSGLDPSEFGLEPSAGDRGRPRLAKGFSHLDGTLLRLMGERATASCGAVVAHHQSPLAAVVRELRASERRAKEEGGRNAFSLSVMKRSGGALRLTANWGAPVHALRRLCAFLAEPEVSRRAVYNSAEWLVDLPLGQPDFVAAMLAYQFERQAGPRGAELARRHDLPGLARELADLAHAREPKEAANWLQNFMFTAEFLARESRTGA